MSPSTAQDNFTGFWEPEIALNYKVVSDYSHNYSIRQRNYFYDDNNLQLNTRQLDISHFSKLRVRDNQSLSLGILYRFRDNFEPDRENELRLTQQYNLINKPTTIRFGHRFRAEQRINASLTTHRFRYRFALDVPLSGENLDIGEPYLISSLESLMSVARTEKPQYDQRFTGHGGWLLNKGTKLQLGLEYRFEDYFQQTENIIFLLTSLVFSL